MTLSYIIKGLDLIIKPKRYKGGISKFVRKFFRNFE